MYPCTERALDEDDQGERTCPDCGGNGEITVNPASCFPRDPQQDRDVPCDACHGTGVVRPGEER